MLYSFSFGKNKQKIHPKELKKMLAREIVAVFYSFKEAVAAEKEFERIFEKKNLPSVIKEKKIKEKEMNILDLLVAVGLAKSKTEAKRLVEQGGIKIIKREKPLIEKDWKKTITIEEMVIQSGKRNFVRIKKS